MTRVSPELEQLPARIRGIEVENAALRALVENLKRANATYSAGWATWHRERNEMRSQLELAMRWGAEYVDAAGRVGGRVLEAANAMRDWLVAGRAVAEERGAAPETLAELDALIGAYDAARGTKEGG